MSEVVVWQASIDAPCKFMDYEFTMSHGGLDKSLYRVVFTGNLPVNDFAELYILLNTTRPEGYSGHSLSVSDVVTVDGKNYFVDSYEFKEIDWED